MELTFNQSRYKKEKLRKTYYYNVNDYQIIEPVPVRKFKTDTEKEKIKLGKSLLRHIEKVYELPYKAFYLRHNDTMRPAKACYDSNLSDLRTVAFFCMMQSGQNISDNCYLEIFGVHRTCIVNMRQVSKNLSAAHDEKFMEHYNIILPLWENISLQQCKQFEN